MDIYRLLYLTPMPEGIRLQLRRFFMDREFEVERRKAIKQTGTAEDLWESGNWQIEYNLLEEDEASFHSRTLMHRARKLRIPIPPFMIGNAISADYQASGISGHRYFLSISGEQKLRDAIREEERYRSEKWSRRIVYITAITGLIGTITGLVVALAKWHL